MSPLRAGATGRLALSVSSTWARNAASCSFHCACTWSIHALALTSPSSRSVKTRRRASSGSRLSVTRPGRLKRPKVAAHHGRRHRGVTCQLPRRYTGPETGPQPSRDGRDRQGPRSAQSRLVCPYLQLFTKCAKNQDWMRRRLGRLRPELVMCTVCRVSVTVMTIDSGRCSACPRICCRGRTRPAASSRALISVRCYRSCRSRLTLAGERSSPGVGGPRPCGIELIAAQRKHLELPLLIDLDLGRHWLRAKAYVIVGNVRMRLPSRYSCTFRVSMRPSSNSS